MTISVALCTCNGEAHLEEQLRSIVTQILPVHEIIICDDASTDATLSIVRKFQSGHQNIQLFENALRLGVVKNFEHCIGRTTGDIIFLSDQDDVWFPDKVQCMVRSLNAMRHYLMAFSNARLIDDKGQDLGDQQTLWDKWGFSPDLQKQWRNNELAFSYLLNNNNKITGATVAFKRELLKYIFPFDLPLHYWHDAWLGLMAASRNGLVFVAEPTLFYRIHKNQQIGLNQGDVMKGDLNKYISLDEFRQRVRREVPGFGFSFRHLLNRFINKFRYSKAS